MSDEVDLGLYREIKDEYYRIYQVIGEAYIANLDDLVVAGLAYVDDEGNVASEYANMLLDDHIADLTNDRSMAALAATLSSFGLNLSEWAERTMRFLY